MVLFLWEAPCSEGPWDNSLQVGRFHRPSPAHIELCKALERGRDSAVLQGAPSTLEVKPPVSSILP